MPTLVPVDHDPFEPQNALGAKSALQTIKEWLPTTWPAKIAQDLWSAATLPGDVAYGKVDPNSQEALERTFGMTGFLAGGAPMAAENSLGIFGGRMARNVNTPGMARAEKLEAMGAHPSDIWKSTGFARGADGEWRFEIPDQNIGFSPRSDFGPMSQTLSHPELYANYPELQKTRLELRNLTNENYGWAEPPIRGLPSGKVVLNQNIPAEEQKATLLHELQHMVQEKEDWARGGMMEKDFVKVRPPYGEISKDADLHEQILNAHNNYPTQATWEAAKISSNWLHDFYKYKDALAKQSWNNYADLAGEVEARNVANRSYLPNELLQSQRPELTEDVPRDWQIVRKYLSTGW